MLKKESYFEFHIRILKYLPDISLWMIKSHTKVVQYKTELIFSHQEIIHHFTIPVFPSGVNSHSNISTKMFQLDTASHLSFSITLCDSAPELLLTETIFYSQRN